MNPVRDILHQRFPHCFADRGQPKRPLAIGIKAEIVSRCPDLRGFIDAALRDYTGGPTYHNACFIGAPRINLDGEIAGQVTPKHSAHHARRLHHLQQKWKREDAKRSADPACPSV